MANFANTETAQKLILDAIRQKNPDIRPGQTFDWLIISNKLRHTIATDDFVSAMSALAAAGMIGADETRRQFILTETGFEALSAEHRQASIAAE
jgi:hypothetical protein